MTSANDLALTLTLVLVTLSLTSASPEGVGTFLAQVASSQKCDLELSTQGGDLTSDFEVILGEVVQKVEKPIWRIDMSRMLIEKGNFEANT